MKTISKILGAAAVLMLGGTATTAITTPTPAVAQGPWDGDYDPDWDIYYTCLRAQATYCNARYPFGTPENDACFQQRTDERCPYPG